MQTGGGSNSTRRPLYFFKVLIGDYEERLRIPSAFARHLSQDLSDIAILGAPSGICWRVKLKRTTGGIYFEDGWEKFSSDHLLRSGEFLVFSYDGDMKFNVQIFGINGCEREDTFSVPYSQDATTHPGKKRCRRPLKESHQNDSVLGKEHPQLQYSGMGVTLMNQNEPIKSEGMSAKDAAHRFTSSFPYFVAEVKSYNWRHFYIPADFAYANLPCVPTNVILENLEGKIWVVTAYIAPKIHCFNGGFKAFLTENDIKEGDFLAFEMWQELNMRVHVFRGDSTSLQERPED